MKDQDKPSARERARAAFKQATKAANRGERAEVDRWIKTADKLADLAERIDALPEPEVEDAEAIRAELRARLARYATVAHEVEEWQFRRDVREAVAAYARKHNLPEPPELEPCPHPEKALELALEDGYWPVPRELPVMAPRVRRRLGLPEEDVWDPYESSSQES